jgi:hypothetical protein
MQQKVELKIDEVLDSLKILVQNADTCAAVFERAEEDELFTPKLTNLIYEFNDPQAAINALIDKCKGLREHELIRQCKQKRFALNQENWNRLFDLSKQKLLKINCNNRMRTIRCDFSAIVFQSLREHNTGYSLRASEESNFIFLELVDENNQYIHEICKIFSDTAKAFWSSNSIENVSQKGEKPSVLITSKITIEGVNKPLITTVLPNLKDNGSMCIGVGGSGGKNCVHGEVIACLLVHTLLKHNSIAPNFRKIEMEVKVLGPLQAEKTTRMCDNCSDLGNSMKVLGYKNWEMRLK